MPARPFTQADIRRAVRGVESCGHEVGRVEILSDGRIVVVPQRESATEERPRDEAEEWLAENG